MTILLTGYTGNVGVEIAHQLAPHRVLALVRDTKSAPQLEGVTLIEGSLECLPAGLEGEVEIIVHSAASVAFKRPLEEWRRTNVEGTAAMLDFARRCPRLRRFIHVSTTCVYGDRTDSFLTGARRSLRRRVTCEPIRTEQVGGGTVRARLRFAGGNCPVGDRRGRQVRD